MVRQRCRGLLGLRLQQLGERVHDDPHLVLTGRDVDHGPLEGRLPGGDHDPVDQDVPGRRDPTELQGAGGSPAVQCATNSWVIESASGPGSGVTRSKLQDGPHEG